jgi:hypothetical protein
VRRHRSQRGSDQRAHVRAWLGSRNAQRQDFANLLVGEPESFGLDNEAQPLALRRSVEPVAGGGCSSPIAS